MALNLRRTKLRHLTHTRNIPDPLCIRGADWTKLPQKSKEAVVEKAFRYWRANGFPYYRLAPRQVRQEFGRVLEHDWDRVCREGHLVSSNSGLRLANAYQPSMWTARVSRYYSPMDVFQNDQMLRAAIRRAFKIWPTRYCANASSLRRILKTFPGAASVSNYRPTVARALICKYAPESGQVVDFAAGYGGRLLGTLAAGRSYLGIEPNLGQIRGFQRMEAAIRAQGFLLPRSQFVQGAAEVHLLNLPRQSADLVFSSPPFFNWEKYSNGKDQSFKRYPLYEEWQSKFLRPVIANSFRILRKSGFMAINVTNGNRRPTPQEVRVLAKESGFTLAAIYPVVFPKVPYLHPRDGNPVKQELLMVFRKS